MTKRIVFVALLLFTIRSYSQTFNELNASALKAAQTGNYDLSINLYNKALKLDKGNPFIFNQIAKVYYRKNDRDSSILYCDSALKVLPKDTSALYQRGYCYMEKEEFAKGVSDFAQVFDLKSRKNPDACFNMGKCYAGLKKFDKAIEAYLLTLQIQPDDKYSFYELGVCYASLDKPDKNNALKYYTKAIDADEKYFNAYLNRGLLYATQFKDYKRSHEDLDRACEIRPKTKYTYIYNSRIYSDEGDFGKAKDVLNKLVDVVPDYADGYLERALVWYKIGILNMVCKDLAKAITLGNKEALQYQKDWCK